MMNNNYQKRILCNNMLKNNKCNYEHNCMYAHSINDQNIIPIRKKIYNYINNKIDMSQVNLLNDKDFFENCLQLTHFCTHCIKKSCSGGLNCRNGAYNITYKICYNDFMYGKCNKYKCNSIHFTQIGLIPYYDQKINIKKKNLIKQYFSSSSTKSDNDSYENEDVESIIKYLNTDNDDDSMDKSIFD
jgi:hypothetical protein